MSHMSEVSDPECWMDIHHGDYDGTGSETG